MLPTFSPQSLDLGKVFVNATDPGVDLGLNDPIPFPSNFPGTIHSDPAPQNTTISVAIVSPSGTFQIRDSILFDVGMVRIFDPDVGHFVRIKAYTFAGSHVGPGSIAVEAGQVLVVRVAFEAGPEPGTQTGQVSITDSDGAATIPVSLQTIARGGMVETSVAADHFSIRAAGAAELPVTVTWKSGPAADVTFRKSDIFLDAKVSMQETTVHVEPGETRNATLLFRADPDAKLGTFDLAIQQIGPNTLPFLDLRVTITPALIVPVDKSIQWHQVGASLAMDKDRGVFYSGHVNAIVPLRGGALLVGADSGGVWSVVSNGAAVPLSNDWDNPDVTCMAVAPDGPNHFYAGCNRSSNGALYESEPNSVFLNFIHWHPVPLVDSQDVPLNTGGVLCIAVTRNNRKLVLGCEQGVFWADIPQSGGAYTFAQVPFLPAMGYSGIAIGPNDTVAVASRGDQAQLSGIFVGGWRPAGLLLGRATILGQFDIQKMRRTSLAVCDSQPANMYAVVAAPDGRLNAILRSTDGGQTWVVVTTNVIGQNVPLESDDQVGGQGWYNNCLTVSPTNPSLVALGWRNGPWFSRDGAVNWLLPKNDQTDNHLHADLHAVVFDPGDPSGQTLYVGCDGGVIVTRDQGASFSDEYNQNLLTFQFEANGRGQYGTFTPSRKVPGLVGGGLQDNGNVFALLDGPSPEWRELDGSDGQVMVFLDTGHVLHFNGNDVNRITAHRFDGSRLVDGAAVPVTKQSPFVNMPGGISTGTGVIVEAVVAPLFRNPDKQQLMYALASHSTFIGGDDVYGLFADDDGGHMHWEYIGSVPGSTATLKSRIFALASLHGEPVFVGTEDGRIFSLSPRSQQALQLTVPISATNPGSIWRICPLRDGVAYALYADQNGQGFLLQSNFFNWDVVGRADGVARGLGLPRTEGQFYGFDIDRGASPPTLFVSTDKKVYDSRDEGDTWQLATTGLPARPHCTELRAVAHDNGQRFLYLTTWGRSLWRATLA